MKTHSDGTTCLEGTQSIPENYIPCCKAFASHTAVCAYDIRYEWWDNVREWVIAISEAAGGGGINIMFCPHCGKRLQR